MLRTSKRMLQQLLQRCDADRVRLDHANALCRSRLVALEGAITDFLEAERAGEMGNRDKAIEHLEKLMELL